MASLYLSLSHSEIMIKSHDYQQVKSDRKVLFLIYCFLFIKRKKHFLEIVYINNL